MGQITTRKMLGVMRVITNDGDVLLGRIIPENMIDETLRRLGSERVKEAINYDTLVTKIVEDGDSVTLANGWRIVRKRVSGENRIELIGNDLWNFRNELGELGVFSEIIQYKTRFFVPVNNKTANILEELTKHRPILDVTKATNNGGGGGSPAFKGLSNWKTARKSGKITKIERPSDIIKSLEKDLKIPITKGKVTRRKALGIFKHSPEAVRLKVENDMPVVAHEIGHYFDKKYNISEDGSIQESIDLLPDDFKDSYKDEEIPGEAMAEFMRMYLLDPEYAQNQMPTLYDYFEKTISKEELAILKRNSTTNRIIHET